MRTLNDNDDDQHEQQNLHSTIKEEEKSDCSHVQSPCPTLDQPLVIVLDDENDDDDDNDDDLIASSIDQNKTTRVKRKANRSKRKKTYRAAVIVERNYMRQSPHRTKLVARRKHQSSSSTVTMSTKNLNMDSNSDSILSRISFDTNTDILTVSRMGSIFYCLEDLYHKVFLSLCSFEEFHDFILKPSIISIKQVTLSEKMAIQQQNPLLKKLSDVPYRLISINSSDYFLKLKQLLINQNHSDDNRQQQQRDKMIDQIIDEMRSYKRTPTPILGKDKVSHSPMTTKRHSSDDEDEDDDDDDDERDHEPCKRLKIVTKKAKTNENPSLAAAQFGIFIQCNGPVSCNIFSTNETVSSSTTTTTTTNNTTSTNDPVKVETDPIGKTSPMKKSSSETENHSRMFIEKFSVSQCNYSSKTNSTNNRIDPTSARDLSQTIKPSPCPTSSPTMTNMPIKRRILNLYNNDGNESSVTAPATHIDSTPRRRTSSHRLFFRSKSFDVTRTSSLTEKVRRRSTTLPSRSTKMIVANRSPVHSKINAMEQCLSKSHPKSSKGESIDLTDENFPMPMIVNVEENVELAHQRQQRKNLESRPPVATPTPSIPKQFHRPTSHENLPNHNNNNNNNNNHHHHHNNSTNNNNTKSSVVPSHPLPASFYRRSPYQAYHHQESYHYRDPTHPSPPVTSSSASGATSMSQSAYSSLHSTNNLSMTTNFYPYPTHPTSAYHSAMKNSKDSPHPNNNHDPRLTSATPNPSQTGLMTQHHQMPPSSVVMPIVRKPNYYHNLTPEQQASIKMQLSPPTSAANPCRLACCYPSSMNPQQQTGHPPSIDKNYHHERMIYREYSAPPTAIKREISQTPDPLSASAAANRKQRRLDSLPPSSSPYPTYPPSKSCFIPPHPPSAATSSIGNGSWPSTSPSVATGAYPPMKPAVRYPYPAPSAPPPMMSSFMQKRIESCFAQNQAVAPVPAAPQRPTPVPARAPSAAPAFVPPTSSTMISPPNTPHDITLPNARLRTIDLQRAMIERGFCDVDKIPKLVIRHLKTYTTRTVETMGQLFPTWFNEPDYRCIHCFRCDQVFTPQQFMTHVDDEQMQNEQPINMTSIQLLTSEKMSEYKVQLWNQFCTNLTVYAREGRIGGFSTNRAV